MKKVLLFIFLGLTFTSCQNKQEVKEESITKNTTEKPAFKMYQASEMAALMEQMYVENLRLKQEIESGEFNAKDFPDFFEKIHSAAFTDPTDLDEFFKTEADRFIKAQKLVYSDSTNRKTNFNQAVTACIECHTVKCTGPIQRIKKLYIE